MKEAALVVGVHPRCMRRYKELYYSSFPSLPTSKGAIHAFMYRNGLPRPKRRPSARALKVVELHEQDRMTFFAIGETLGITRQAAWQAWKRHLRRMQRRLRPF